MKSFYTNGTILTMEDDALYARGSVCGEWADQGRSEQPGTC